MEAASLANWDDRRIAAAGEKLLTTYVEPGTPVHSPLQLFKRIAGGMSNTPKHSAGQQPSGSTGRSKYAADYERRRARG